MTKRIALPAVLLLCVALTACQTEAPQDVDTTEPYEQYGEAVDADGAVPVQAVAAERGEYVGQAIKVEGTIQEVCEARGCWFTFRTDDDVTLRIAAEEDDEGTPVFSLPTEASGHRAIASGVLTEEGAEDEEPRLVLTATGVLVERA